MAAAIWDRPFHAIRKLATAAQQLCKRLNCRGGSPDSDKVIPLLAQPSRTESRAVAGWMVAISWQMGWARCWTAMTP